MGTQNTKAAERVLLTIDREHPLWALARADAASAFLSFVNREIVAGNVADVVVNVGDWLKLQTYLRGLPGGATALPLAVADAPPPAPKETSERALAARKLADVVRALGACSPHGGDVMREESGRYYAVSFSFGSLICGTAFVYSLRYVRISFVSDTGELAPPDGLPRVDIRTYQSVDAVAQFLNLIVFGKQYAKALAIPTHTPKRRNVEGQS